MIKSDTPESAAVLEGGDAAEDVVRFFRMLSAEAQREYAILAARDRRFGEDVAAEGRTNRETNADES
jgi:hypothetical protein